MYGYAAQPSPVDLQDTTLRSRILHHLVMVVGNPGGGVSSEWFMVA